MKRHGGDPRACCTPLPPPARHRFYWRVPTDAPRATKQRLVSLLAVEMAESEAVVGAVWQSAVKIDDVEQNAAKAREVIRRAAAQGAHIIVLSELFLTGYNIESSASDVLATALCLDDHDGPLASIAAAAREHKVCAEAHVTDVHDPCHVLCVGVNIDCPVLRPPVLEINAMPWLQTRPMSAVCPSNECSSLLCNTLISLFHETCSRSPSRSQTQPFLSTPSGSRGSGIS